LISKPRGVRQNDGLVENLPAVDQAAQAEASMASAWWDFPGWKIAARISSARGRRGR